MPPSGPGAGHGEALVMATAAQGGDDGPDLILAAADAATNAARDAEDSARAAASLMVAAQAAVSSAAAVATSASHAIAVAVAATASETAAIAARAATEVEAKVASRAFDAASSALGASVTLAAEVPLDDDTETVSRAAATVAAAVAADVVAKAQATVDSASIIAAAVITAAEAVAIAAATAAATVDLAAGTAEETRRVVASSVAAAGAAADVAVESTTLVADLTSRLRTADAVRRVGDFNRDRLVSELDTALVRAELRLHYQPIYSMQAGTIVAVEALLRWQHPIRGLLRPAEFLDVAEGHALMDRIGDWVLSTAVAQADSWRVRMGVHAPDMWVNIAGDQLAQPHLVGVVERLLVTSGLAPGKLGLEVTERQLIRRADAGAEHLMALRDLGVALAVDDFGTGYASLDYLRRFTFDEIKIDTSFIAGLGKDSTDTAVTSSIIALGRSLGLVVVAEGVETQEQYDHLQAFGCDRSQGYLLHRPAAPEAITEALLGSDAHDETPD
jgi:EAL domain-containing protein (putative c-di-GMP-specific phosphodiesterase class I)